MYLYIYTCICFLTTVFELSILYCECASGEFRGFASNQEECRKKWLSAEDMCAGLQKELTETKSNKGKLELQVRHVTELLKHEIQIRQRLQREEKDLVIVISLSSTASVINGPGLGVFFDFSISTVVRQCFQVKYFGEYYVRPC